MSIVVKVKGIVPGVGGDGSGVPGPQGPAGPQGAQGIQGIQGEQGPQGLPGANGREVQLQKSATHIQWRYVGDVNWINLVALADLSTGDGSGGSGTNGREIELQASGTHIQWRYVGEVAWINLVALALITGPQGAQGIQGIQGIQGAAGAQGPQGEQGIQGPQGVQGIQGAPGADGQPAAYTNNIADTNSIPFTHPLTIVAAHAMSGVRVIAPNTVGALAGMGAMQRITADGVNVPDLSAFKKINGSPAFINSNGKVNLIAFMYDGVDYRYAIVQDVADLITLLNAPVATIGAKSSSTLAVSWTNVANESGYTVQIATDAAFTLGVQTANKAADVLTHTFTGLGATTTYYQRVKATGDGINYGDSAWSNTVSDTTSGGIGTLVYEHTFNSDANWDGWDPYNINNGSTIIIDHNGTPKLRFYGVDLGAKGSRYRYMTGIFNPGEVITIKIIGVVLGATSTGMHVVVAGAGQGEVALANGDNEIAYDTTGSTADRLIYIWSNPVAEQGVASMNFIEKIEIYKQ